MKIQKIPIKLRLFLPVGIIVTIIIVILSIWILSDSLFSFKKQLESNLHTEVHTITKMFDRERSLQMENVRKNLRLASLSFHSQEFKTKNVESISIEVENQFTKNKHITPIQNWELENKVLFQNTAFVDSLQLLLGGTITIFQRIDSGFVRISTNVMNNDSSKAIGTYIPNNSPVTETILQGENYIGRAYVVNDWYTTAYEPIYDKDSIIGMLYVGNKEKDLAVLKSHLAEIQIGKSGYPFVFDKNGYLLIHPQREGEFWGDSLLFLEVQEKQNGILYYSLENIEKLIAFSYYPNFELYIAAAVFVDEETADLRHAAIKNAIITVVVALIFLLLFIYIFTTEKIYHYFSALEKSRKRLDSVSIALEESEERFKKLFDSTGDDIFVSNMQEEIVEVNNAACTTLGYSKEELLKMKMADIKSNQFVDSVQFNREKIITHGSYQFDSEHITKDGRIVSVEFISRLITYNNEKFILSVVRNISRRRKEERQVLSAVIQAEEKERQRFAKDMHDGLGPLLSTIKLYVNELKSDNLPPKEKEDLIQYSNELLDEAVESTRNISNNMMPNVIHSYGLIKAVENFCNKVNKTNAINVQFETENIYERIDQNLELIFFRVISELINNTLKHAKAKKIIILLLKKDDKLILNFKDDGIGFNIDDILTDKNKGMGLKNIISRIKSINGKYYFNSSPNKGFTIRIEVRI